ncbi:hypothetical protein UB51_08675 [Paenibacillus sp. IHBB 10380]|nr:hypothetical protein UB51_08675 [Paenibacillus sp. IHBB 10380]
MAANRLIWTSIKTNSDLVVELVPFLFLHKYVSGEGFEEFNVLINMMNTLPIEVSYVNNLKQAAFLNLISLLVQFIYSITYNNICSCRLTSIHSISGTFPVTERLLQGRRLPVNFADSLSLPSSMLLILFAGQFLERLDFTMGMLFLLS